MSTTPSSIDPFSARLPAFCVDWRFLLPLRRGARLLVLGDAGQAFAPYFAGLGVLVVSLLPLAQLRAASSLPGSDQVVFDPAHPPFAPHAFDLLALPFGLPPELGKGSPGLAHLGALLAPAGMLLAGSLNRWSPWRASASAQVVPVRRLLDRAGFTVSQVYGVAPDLVKPGYIMPLTRQALDFFLRHRYSGKRLKRLSFLLSIPLLSSLLARLLPGYYLLAQRRAS